MFPKNSERLIGVSDAFSALNTGIGHLAHVLGLDLYIQAMPVGTYRVQSPGFPKIVY